MKFGPTTLPLFLFLTHAALAHSPAALAQAIPVTTTIANSGSSTANKLGPAGIVPVQTGYNLSLVSASQSDSGGGWSSILTPIPAYRFNRHVSADFATPTYLYFLASVNTGTTASPTYTLEPRHFALGDSTLAAHLNFDGDPLSYSFTAALGLPTGNSTYGLTAGQTTYNFNNHFDLSFGPVSPDIELGLSDSSTLVNQRISRARSFSSTGKLAHFQAGASIDLPAHCSFDAEAYEDLPLGAQQVIGSTKGKHGTIGRGKSAGRANSANAGKLGTTSTATSSGLAEDNGIDTSLDVPLSPHLVVSGLYSYSIRQQDRTAGFSLTYLFRARPTQAH